VGTVASGNEVYDELKEEKIGRVLQNSIKRSKAKVLHALKHCDVNT
jgi:hypothetical protein